MDTKKLPVHRGEILREEFVKPRGLSQNAGARARLIFQTAGVFLVLTLQVYGEGKETIAGENKAGGVITNTVPAEIKTLDGKTYKSVHSLKVAPGGLVVQFTPAGGGMGIAKIKFENLPADLQQRYGSDIEKAPAHEAEQTKGQAMVAAKMWADHKDATNKLAILLAKEKVEAQARAEQRRIEYEKEEDRRRTVEAVTKEMNRQREAEREKQIEDAYWISRKAAEDAWRERQY